MRLLDVRGGSALIMSFPAIQKPARRVTRGPLTRGTLRNWPERQYCFFQLSTMQICVITVHAAADVPGHPHLPELSRNPVMAARNAGATSNAADRGSSPS
jgi:hypothetical protein